MSKNTTSESGFILVAVVAASIFITLLGIISLEMISANLRTAKNDQYRFNAQLAADAGLDDAIRQLNLDGTWAGSGSEITLMNEDNTKTTYTTEVIDGDTDFQKFINVTAHSYTPSTSTTPKFTRKYQTELRGVGSGDYSVVGGVGGLILRNNAKILDGRVFVNGNISLYNSSQIGLDLIGIPVVPVQVSSAHQSCPVPADATYPRVCNPGENGEPIALNHPQSRIYGEVRANNQTNGTQMYAPGLVAGSVTPSPLPEHDRNAQKAAISNTMSGSAAGCTVLGTKVWPANTKIEGDVTLSGVCVVTIEGDVWITGNLRVSNTSIILVKAGLSTQPQIMVDGTSGVVIRNAAALNANLSGVGMRFITYASNAACSPECANVTGTALYNSRNMTTISIENSASAGRTEFYARWSKVSVSNGGNIGALAGQTVEISNSAAITFGTSVSGFSGPTAWVVKSYKRVY